MLHKCNRLRGVGINYWSNLFAKVGKLAGGRAIPDSVVYHFSPHWYAQSTSAAEPNCGLDAYAARYVRHVDFALQSLRSLYGGPLFWRATTTVEYDARRPVGFQAPGCISTDRLLGIHDQVVKVLPRHDAVVLPAYELTLGMANHTIDNMHFSGGMIRPQKADFGSLGQPSKTACTRNNHIL